ncbi:MAG: alpha-isopropylmalate synthase regulatory domain-containing protein [bacterium]
MGFDKKFYMNNFFKLERYRVSADKFSEDAPEVNEATVKISVPARNIPRGFDARCFAVYQPGDRKFRALSATSGGNGTVDALDRALRKLLVPIYPFLKDVRLIRYGVQNTSFKAGTSSEVEVFILATNGEGKLYYSEVYSKSVIEASFLALANIYNRYFRDDYNVRRKPGK